MKLDKSSNCARRSQYNLAPHMAAGYGSAGYGYRSSTPAYDTPHGGSYMGTYGSSAAGGYANVNAYDSYVPPSPQSLQIGVNFELCRNPHHLMIRSWYSDFLVWLSQISFLEVHEHHIR